MFEYVKDKIEHEWQPDWNMKEERQYRDDLLTFLDKRLKKTHQIGSEDGRGLADIGIDGEIGIELKLDLYSKSEIDRLTGQVVRYLKGRKGYDGIIIVLLGKVSPTVVRDVRYNMREVAKSHEEPDPILGSFRKVQSKKIALIAKSPSKAQVS